MATKTKRSPALVLVILGFVFAFFIFGIALITVNPELENTMMSQKRTEQNFSTALVQRAPGQAQLFPVTISVPYKTVNGAPQMRDVIAYGYGVTSDGSKCVQFFNMASSEKDVIKQACVIPAKEIKHEPSQISKAVQSASSWKIWGEFAKFAHGGYYFYQ